MSKGSRLRNFVYFIVLSIFGVVAVILFGVLFSSVLSLFKSISMEIRQIILTWTAMIMGLCIVPYLIVKKVYAPTAYDIGIGKIKRYEIFGICLIAFLAIAYLLLKRPEMNLYILMAAIIQNIGVSMSEEFFSKGILFYIARKITKVKIIVVVMSAVVFAFFFHSEDLFITNLTYRFPMGIILGIIYLKSENIYLPITLHLANNLIATSVLK
ncbi:MAG: CPBP family intramembrane metalloprotease [Butyrivibrio sp.]|uniref:CPBP family intramembrane glutamic endopeptidase n=1 Tax=Butyrivibrio sp. TaxID=28121 RepID=UPI001EB8D715|nr:CPBP family intramembrane glutamic endopeptidase [Butyrivibrio sp.]MBE5841267.1 CPBP family intramembrane metalloprotease [Butyrivibrio sp.]